MEAFSALLALRAGNSLFTGEFPSQRPVTESFDVFFKVIHKEFLDFKISVYLHNVCTTN